MPAETTNAISNAVHALCLLLYFLCAWRHFRTGHSAFTPLVVAMFGLMFAMKVLGVAVHGIPHGPLVQGLWITVALMLVLLNASTIKIVGGRTGAVAAAAIITAGCVIAFVASAEGDFAFLAAASVVVFTAAALLSKGWLRSGFFMIAGSNVAWIAARKITEANISSSLPISLRYDNDFYHLLLIASTFVIYKGFVRRGQEADLTTSVTRSE